MKAIVYEHYGSPDVLHLVDVARPKPKDDEVLVKVRATSINRTDCGWRSATPFFSRAFTGLARPKRKILGSELAGEVVEVGASVTEFEIGEAVFGVNAAGLGAHAEFVCMRESAPLTSKPINMSFEEAAGVCDGGIIALACLRRAGLKQGQTILIYGASGSIGAASVQLAKHFGAQVTAVCDTKNVDIVRSLGADEVIDYTRTDFTKSGGIYDVVFDAVGKTSFRRCRNMVKKGGVYVDTDLGFLWHVPLLALSTWIVGSRRVTLPVPRYTKQDVVLLKELIETGRYRAVIDRCYPLEQAVDAARFVETEQKTGNVVLIVSPEPDPVETAP